MSLFLVLLTSTLAMQRGDQHVNLTARSNKICAAVLSHRAANGRKDEEKLDHLLALQVDTVSFIILVHIQSQHLIRSTPGAIC